jgi:hypothetical protein
MNIRQGDCIPVRIDPKQWAPYIGRVVGYDSEKRALIVTERDGKFPGTRLVVHMIEPTKNWWQEIK